MKATRRDRSFFRHIFILPFALAMLIPLFFFDLCLSLYHRIAFGICKMKRVNRASHFKIDQMRVAQLEKMERFFAIYIYYARGLMSYGSKIVSESENYWCQPRPVRGRQKMMVDKSKMGVKELQAYQKSVKQKPKKSRKK